MKSESLIALAEVHEELYSRWIPHEGQIPIGRSIFYEGKKKIFIAAGRSFGKSQCAAFLCVRIALENPGSTNYIFAPYIGQGKEIYWSPRLLHKLIPEHMIESDNSTEMRIILTNGSMIKVCGAENYEAYRGVKLNPGSICIIEELKDCRAAFLDAFLPNLSVNDPILMMIGTPPYRENHFVHYMNHAKKSDDWFYYWAPTEVNPHVSRDFLKQQREFLVNNGMEDVWEAEYMARFTLGGHRSIFPMIAKMPLVPFEEAWPKDSHKWVLMVGKDPASSSTFAVTFWLYNPFNKRVISVGEIHETRPEYMTARRMYHATLDRVEEFRKRGIKDVRYVYDNAARWYAQEINEIDVDSKMWLEPCDKTNGLQGEISCWRGVAVHGLLTLTDATPELKKELDNYILDEKGRLPDKEDDLLQSGAYALRALGFDFTETLEPRKIQSEEPRGYRMEDEINLGNEYQEFDGGI